MENHCEIEFSALDHKKAGGTHPQSGLEEEQPCDRRWQPLGVREQSHLLLLVVSSTPPVQRAMMIDYLVLRPPCALLFIRTKVH